MMDRRDIEFPTADKTVLRGWFYPARGEAADQKSPCIILANGVGFIFCASIKALD